MALSQRSVIVNNVYDRQELVKIHPQLRFDSSVDEQTHYKTRSMIVIPIKCRETPLGVMQIINHVNGPFTDHEMQVAAELVPNYRPEVPYDFQATQSPFDYLLRRKLITIKNLREQRTPVKDKISQAPILITEMKLSTEEIRQIT